MSNSTPPPQNFEMLASGRWFSGLPTSLQEALRAGARGVTLKAGETVFLRGDSNDGLYGVTEGTIRFGACNLDGREFVVGLAEPPQWFGEVALLDGGQRTHDAWAESNTTLAHVSMATIAPCLADHPEYWRYMGALAVHKLRAMFMAIEDASLHSSRERLIRCLVLLVSAYGQREPVPTQVLRLSQERLGSMLSLSRQTVNALLRDLEREGVVACMRGGVRIRNLKRLLDLETSIE